MSQWANAIRAALRAPAHTPDAPAMAAYMKHVQPFLGVKAPARRAAILAQLHAKSSTDPERLRETTSLLKHAPEFFVPKAVGWALREYAKTDAGWVKLTVKELGLTGSARREALKPAGQA